MFCVITNIYNKKNKGPTLMELFTATGKLEKSFFFTAVSVAERVRRLRERRKVDAARAVNDGASTDQC